MDIISKGLRDKFLVGLFIWPNKTENMFSKVFDLTKGGKLELKFIELIRIFLPNCLIVPDDPPINKI